MKTGITVLFSVIAFFVIAYVFAWFIAPGSYARAETYEFDLPEDSLIQIINSVKMENPNLTLDSKVQIPDGGTFYLEGGREVSTDHWYHIYFYYPDKNQIIHTWTRPETKTKTTFAFVAVNDGLTLGNWKTVNSSFWWWKNKPEIDEFEQRIMKRIKNKVKRNLTQ